MRIPDWPIHTEREIELLGQVLASRQWGGWHEFVGRLETEFAAFQHCAHGIAAANGTVTLEVALAAVGIGPGDEVIVPAISFVSTATAVSRVGALPVFVDIEPYSFNLDPERVREAVTPRTRAVIPAHFGGPPADMDRLGAITGEFGLALIEDAAHAQGSEWNGRRAGSFGVISSFSFQNGKVITAGEGGMLTTSDAEVAERARSLVNQGRRPGASYFDHFILTSNFRMAAFQAAVLLAQLERLPEQNRVRAGYGRLLRRELADVAGLRLQEIPAQVTANSNYLVLGRIDAERFGVTRDEFHSRVTAAGIPCTPFYPHTLYGNPLYREGGCRVHPCPNAEASIRDAFWFPHRVLMADEETTLEIAGVVRSISRNRG
jgi:dTDP-4-amino-4,6-dideoxygalactose transaminase